MRKGQGPSGPNSDYVMHLQTALADLEIVDEHVEAIARWLR